MSARTVVVRRALAQAGARGLAHVANQQDTGTWITVCGRQVRGQDVRADGGPAAGVHAEHLGARFCGACADLALAVADSIADGVGVLLRHGSTEQAGVQLRLLAVDAVLAPGDRRSADQALVESVRQQGVLAPIAVRRTREGFMLVTGARRLHAARSAGLTEVPALVRDVTEETAALQALTENLHRLDLDPIAQAVAFQDALDRFGLSKETLAGRLGVSRPQVSNTVRLLALPAEVRAAVAAGRLTAAHGRAVLRLEGEEEQLTFAAEILGSGLSTHAADAAVRQRSAGVRFTDPALDAAQQLLAARLAAKVKVTARGEHTRISIDVPAGALERVLAQLGGGSRTAVA